MTTIKKAPSNEGNETNEIRLKDTDLNPEFLFEDAAKKGIDLNNAITSPDGNIYLPDGILEKYNHLQITDTTQIETPTPVVCIGGEVISTEGNITTLSGASKSGKSAFTGLIIAGSITDEFSTYDGFPDVGITQNKKHKAVIHFDTEQARHKHKSNLISIRNRAGLTCLPGYFRSYNIRELDVSEYKKVTTEIVMAASKNHSGVFLIVIDGIADYVRDVNDADGSNEIVAYLEKLAIQHKCPIITIVHTNPNSDKERGHLGSQLQRKSESVLMVKTEGDVSTLEPKFLRNAGKGNIPLIQFIYDPNKGYHTFCGIRANEDAKKDEQRIERIQEVADNVFGGQKSYSYGDAIDAIMRHTKKSMAPSKNMFTEMKAHKMIVQSNDNNWRKNGSV